MYKHSTDTTGLLKKCGYRTNSTAVRREYLLTTRRGGLACPP